MHDDCYMSPAMRDAIAYDEAHPPEYGEMSAADAMHYSELEERMCRCVGDDNSRCLPHNERFHSMSGVDEYDKMMEE